MYKLTFEDGSSGYLEHHGVKGMKWGVWNAETRQRYSGSVNSFKMGEAEYAKRLEEIGYSSKQSQRIAREREWYKKAAIGALTVGAAAGIAAVGFVAIRRYGTRTLKAGQLLQTVHAGDISERIGKQSFYASYTKADNAIYNGFFGSKAGTNVTKLAAKQDIRIASEARSHKIFRDTVKQNPMIKWEENGKVNTMLFNDYLSSRGIDPAKASSLKTYRAFNHDLVHKSKPIYNAAHDAFYGNMKKQGFGALTDSYNAFGTHGYSYRPVIVFGDVKFNVAKQTVTKASDSAKRKTKAYLISAARPSGNNSMKTIAVGAYAASLVGVTERSVRSRENFAKQYRKDHPGTAKTDAQLRAMYDRSHITDPLATVV